MISFEEFSDSSNDESDNNCFSSLPTNVSNGEDDCSDNEINPHESVI